MADPKYVFNQGPDSKRNTLRLTWPELFDALAGVGDATVTMCASCPPGQRPRGEAMARLRVGGRPVCTRCLEGRWRGHDVVPLNEGK